GFWLKPFSRFPGGKRAIIFSGETTLQSQTLHFRSNLLLLAIPFLLSIFWLLHAWKGPLIFDDAYMFYRYALNIRHGLGIAWNPDGVPTYGLTSHLWVWCVLPFTLLPVAPGVALQFASWLT